MIEWRQFLLEKFVRRTVRDFSRGRRRVGVKTALNISLETFQVDLLPIIIMPSPCGIVFPYSDGESSCSQPYHCFLARDGKDAGGRHGDKWGENTNRKEKTLYFMRFPGVRLLCPLMICCKTRNKTSQGMTTSTLIQNVKLGAWQHIFF